MKYRNRSLTTALLAALLASANAWAAAPASATPEKRSTAARVAPVDATVGVSERSCKSVI
ncbi:hypothetical protein DWB77_00182 [Streptomyces hundungensis]|uniref:Uncharacterized protein n=1 Tax=Streptomyces hundungensis TaxID=1077946 RepID=A0A387H334_9ACTN|nr:hypothetical protein DWB77_00182 [Streptomyces hundungensis]